MHNLARFKVSDSVQIRSPSAEIFDEVGTQRIEPTSTARVQGRLFFGNLNGANQNAFRQWNQLVGP
jgi:hypothetical protein